MGYRPSSKSGKSSRRRYGKYVKPLAEKGKSARKKRNALDASAEEMHVTTANEVWEGTLKRLHVLGGQRFGCSPFSEHFNRWVMNLTDILDEFASNPEIGVDDQFRWESREIVSHIKLDLENRRSKETSAIEQATILSHGKTNLTQIKEEYFKKAKELKAQKTSEIKRLNSSIDRLRQDLDTIVRVKAGFFRSISKKEREQKEQEISQELSNRQSELEMALVDFAALKRGLLDEYESKRAPVAKQVKEAQRTVEEMETDGSLEERWFACEALADAVNALMQRKKLQPPDKDDAKKSSEDA
jgi:hypothetical protein